MKEIKEYNNENIQRLKRWMADSVSQGHRKYFEILVDGIRVVYKTDNFEDFDQHTRWMDENAQSMRIQVYNTKNSHRSQVFEFRTTKYLDGVSDKLFPTRKPRLSEEEIDRRVQQTLEEKQRKYAFAETQKQNRDLTRRLQDAETYIRKLERQADENNSDENFDLNGLISKAALFVSNNPDLKEKLGGIQNLFSNNIQKAVPNEETNSEPTVTFRKVKFKDTAESETKHAESQIRPDKNNTFCLNIPCEKLDEEKSRQLYELAYFMSQNTEYISIVYGLMKNEETKLT